MKKNQKFEPLIRFEGYDVEWEHNRFLDFTKLSQGLQIAISERFLEPGKNRHFYITNEFLNPSSSKQYYIESPNKSVIATEEDILMTRTGNTGKVVTDVNGAFHNNFFKIAYEKAKTDKRFLYYLLVHPKTQKEILVRAGTSTIPDLNHNDFYRIKVEIPLIEEQTKVGQFFRTLDSTIALHERQLENHKTFKKTMLQKMFPKKDEKVPEIRFARFMEDWVQRQLGELAEITMGQSPDSKNYTENPADYILVQGNADMKNGKVTPRIWTTQITKMASSGDLILSVRAPVGDVGKTDYDVVLGRGVAGVKGNEFLFQTLDRLKGIGFWDKVSTGSTFESINSSDIKNALIMTPSIEEQTKIGQFFQNLDSIISHHENELENLKTLKETMLAKMFV